MGTMNMFLPTFESDTRSWYIHTVNESQDEYKDAYIRTVLLTTISNKQTYNIDISETSFKIVVFHTFSYSFDYLIPPIIISNQFNCGTGQSTETFDFNTSSYTYDGGVIDIDYSQVYKVNETYNLQLYPNKLISLLVSFIPPLHDPSQILNFSNDLLRQLAYKPVSASLQTIDPSQILNFSNDLLQQLAYKPVSASLQTVDPSQILNFSNALLQQLAYKPVSASIQTVDPSQILNFSNALLQQLTYVEAKDNTLYDNISDGYNRFMASMEEPNTFTVRTTRPGENGKNIETCYNPDGGVVDCPPETISN
jgi:hypothetical protein